MSIAVRFGLMVKETIQRVGFFFRTLTQRRLGGLDLLERDHVGVELLFLQWRFARSKARKQRVFESIKQEVLAHSQLEESIFYPACEKFPELKRLASESIQDHKHLKTLFKDIEEISITSDKADVKIKMLMEEFRHHVDKEENMMFPRFRALAKKAQIEKLGRDIRMGKELSHKREAA